MSVEIQNPEEFWFGARAEADETTAVFVLRATSEDQARQKVAAYCGSMLKMKIETNLDQPDSTNPHIVPLEPAAAREFSQLCLPNTAPQDVHLLQYRHPPVNIPPPEYPW